MIDLSLMLWAVIPPVLLLLVYHYRVTTAPSLLQLFLFFLFGFIAGSFADFFGQVFDNVAGVIVNEKQIQPSFPGEIFRQLLQVAPIAEGCKLAAVVIPLQLLQIQSRLCISSIFLFAIATGLGFTAQENLIYLFSGTVSALERLLFTPVQAILSAPWGYALGMSICLNIRSHRYTQSVTVAWLMAVAYHALVNVLSAPGSRGIFDYALFPLLLWLFWQMEQLLRRVQTKYPINIISGNTTEERYWQIALMVLAFFLGGNAIFGLFNLAKTLRPLGMEKAFSAGFLLPTLSQVLVNLLLGVLGWGIFRYLRDLPRY
ncbi:PrsW family glutamic-type intramembrane protease [Calothrix rhizosoleniae]|uniref:PrsW family glutamic-type intramembrane protease n=1 Tax=Calothrix rhizosoleniae TaxID=888997 RepID=UPI000B49AC45|nr:PrsW family glutamic-type intramembrane protease [Calothrix rhizosoleniae]